MIRTAFAVIFTLAISQGQVAAAGDAAAGQAKAAVCAACHGPDGNSTNPEWPSLAGQHASYISRQIEMFQAAEARNNALMAPMIASLTEADIADLSVYFESLPRRGMMADAGAREKISQGERLYRGGDQERGIAACMACHGPSGNGNAPGAFPSVSAQHATYTAIQLKAYRSGQRSSDPNAMMRDIASKLTDEDIEAVSAYLAGLH